MLVRLPLIYLTLLGVFIFSAPVYASCSANRSVEIQSGDVLTLKLCATVRDWNEVAVNSDGKIECFSGGRYMPCDQMETPIIIEEVTEDDMTLLASGEPEIYGMTDSERHDRIDMLAASVGMGSPYQ